MVSKKKDNPNGTAGADGAPGSSKRPSRIIELEADEVETEIKPGEDVPPGEEAPDEDSADPEPSDESGEEQPPPPPAPQRTRPSDVKGFVTHLAAGLIGGLIGVVGAGIGLGKLALPGGGDAPERITRIEQRLNALDAKLKGDAKADSLEKLDARLTVVEKTPEAVPAVPKDLNDRLSKLEDTLKTLISAAGEEGASGLELSAALTDRIEAVSSDLEKRTATLKDEITELKSTLQERDASQTDNGGATSGDLAGQIKKLEERVSELAALPASAGQASAARGTGTQGAALTLAFESLRRGVESGEAFTVQLEALAKLAPDGLDLSGLAKYAGAGAGTERTLLRALPAILRDARAATANSDDDTFLARLVSNARSVVRVRRIGPAEGESNGAVLSRMEARMKAADLNGVLREAKGLSGPALETVQPWLGKAMARQASQAGLDALEQSLLASLKPDTGAKK